MSEPQESAKRPLGDPAEGEEASKRPRAADISASSAPEPEVADPEDEPDDFDALLDGAGADLLSEDVAPPDPADEVARRAFAERVSAAKQVGEAELPELLAVLQKDAPAWVSLRRWRSAALLAVCVARSSRVIRAAFVTEGLPALGALLQESVHTLETGDAAARQEAGMWSLACLMCLRALSLGRATLWEHRQILGKPFDRLHRWCAKEKSALAAELRAPTSALCRRWRRQPKPAGQEVAPEQKAIRSKVLEVIQQGLMGISGGNSPASPAPMTAASPGALPNRLVAAEVEAALHGKFGSTSHEYKQHARMLRTNLALPGNAKLRERVLAGDIGAEELVAMDSDALAPDALREQRRVAKEKAMKEVVYEELLPRMPSKGEGSPGRDSYTMCTAPPVFVKSPAWGGSSGDLGAESSGSQKPEVPVQPLVPPPTPFQDIGLKTPMVQDSEHHHDVDVLPTPAPDDEDEEQEALIQYLSKPVRL